jgi:hypothetical protein
VDAMPQNYVEIRLDTTAPTGLAVSIDNGAVYASSNGVVTLTFSLDASETDTTGYQLLVWGDVNGADANVKIDEATSTWMTYTNTYTVTLDTTIDGTKTINARVRDDVWNSTTTPVTAHIQYDKTLPVVTTTNPDRAKISTVADSGGRDRAQFTFTTDVPIKIYEVRVVGSTGADHTTGSVIQTTAGSVNTSGDAGAGTFDSNVTPIPVTIMGLDLQSASSGDDIKTIKVFVQDEAGNWSA